MSPQLKAGYMLTEGLKVKHTINAPVVFWNDFYAADVNITGNIVSSERRTTLLFYIAADDRIQRNTFVNYNFNACMSDFSSKPDT